MENEPGFADHEDRHPVARDGLPQMGHIMRKALDCVVPDLMQADTSPANHRPTLPGLSCSESTRWMRPRICGEGRPKEEEGEVGGETLRKRQKQRMLEDTEWGDVLICTGLGVPVVGLWHPQGDLVLCPGLTRWSI